MTKEWKRASVGLVMAVVVLGTGACARTGPIVKGAKPLRNLFAESERVAWLPRNEAEYTKVFAKVPNGAQLNKNLSSLDALEVQGDLRVFAPIAKRTISQQTMELVRTTRKSIITVVGHNEGGVMKAVDGSTVRLQELADNAPKDTVVLVLSCNAEWYVKSGRNSIGPFTKIDPTAAADIERAFYAHLELVPRWPPSRAELDEAYGVATASYEQAKRSRRAMTYAKAGGGVGGAGGVVFYIETRQSASP